MPLPLPARLTPEEAQEASYFAASARISSFCCTVIMADSCCDDTRLGEDQAFKISYVSAGGAASVEGTGAPVDPQGTPAGNRE